MCPHAYIFRPLYAKHACAKHAIAQQLITATHALPRAPASAMDGSARADDPREAHERPRPFTSLARKGYSPKSGLSHIRVTITDGGGLRWSRPPVRTTMRDRQAASRRHRIGLLSRELNPRQGRID